MDSTTPNPNTSYWRPDGSERTLAEYRSAVAGDDLTPTEALARIAGLESDLSDPAVIACEPDHLPAMREELDHLRLSVVPTVGRPVLERRKPVRSGKEVWGSAVTIVHDCGLSGPCGC